MGLLDDAIREHLELKRRHGAAEDEVARQEQEALGPPRRGEVPEPLAPPAAPAGGEPAPEDVPAAAVEPAGDLAPDLEPDPVPSVYEDEPWLEEPAPPAPPQDAAPGTDTALPQDAGPGEEDVLEETPEFLQETPEHDRLWFEQKPPKDFDFDK